MYIWVIVETLAQMSVHKMPSKGESAIGKQTGEKCHGLWGKLFLVRLNRHGCQNLNKWWVFCMCSRGLRKLSNLGTNLVCFDNIPCFSRHDVNTYGFFMIHCDPYVFWAYPANTDSYLDHAGSVFSKRSNQKHDTCHWHGMACAPALSM